MHSRSQVSGSKQQWGRYRIAVREIALAEEILLMMLWFLV